MFWGHLLHGGGFAIHAALVTLYVSSLGATPGQIGLVVGGGAVARMALAVPAGALVDRISAKPVIVAMMAMPVIGAIIFMLSSAWWHTLLGVVFIELSGLSIPAVSAYIASATNPAIRTRAYTYIYSIAIQVGMMAAPIGAGFVAEAFGFRLVYAIAGILFAAAVGVFTMLANPRSTQQADNADRQHGAGYGPVLRMPSVWVVVALHVLVPLLPYIGLVMLPNFLVDERGLTLGKIGTLASIGSGAGLIFSIVVSHWSPLTRPFFGMSVCLMLVSAALGLYLLSGALSVIVLAYMLRAAMGPVWSLIAAAVADVTPERLRGRAYGLCELGAGIGDVSAPLASGHLYGVDHRLPLTIGFIATVPLAISAAVLHQLRGRLVAEEVANGSNGPVVTGEEVPPAQSISR
jgi:MFS family permease